MLEKESVIRKQIISLLEEQLKSNNVKDLILYGNQKEFMLGLTKYQIYQIEKEGRYILKVLQVVSHYYDECKSITWRTACEIASDELVTDVCRHTIERWYVLYKDNNYKLPVSKRGKHSITKDLNSFLLTEDKGTEKRDNNDVYRLLRSWALEHLEELTIESIGKKINELLLPLVKNDTTFVQYY